MVTNLECYIQRGKIKILKIKTYSDQIREGSKNANRHEKEEEKGGKRRERKSKWGGEKNRRRRKKISTKQRVHHEDTFINAVKVLPVELK